MISLHVCSKLDLKTRFRNQMGQSCLTGLGFVNIHSKNLLYTYNIIDRFAKSKHKIDFILKHIKYTHNL